jgi:hypothetical protein
MYFVCTACYKWSQTPAGFDERKHFVKCECGKNMYLTHGTPKEAAYPDRDEIKATLVQQ